MKMLNAVEDAKLAKTRPVDARVLQETFGILLRTLYPAAPHITHALWQELGYAQGPWATSSTRPGRR